MKRKEKKRKERKSKEGEENPRTKGPPQIKTGD